MGYSPEVYTKINEMYTEKRRLAIQGLEERTNRARAEVPGIADIDDVLRATGLRAMEAMRKNDGGKAFAEVRAENERLVEKRRRLLIAHGLPGDYLDPKFDCSLCGDTGFVNGRRCSCLKKALYDAQAALSGLGSLLGSQTFENFSLAFYPDKENAKRTVDSCEDFAKSGVANGENLLLMGATGLGKTHLSTAIADVVMQNGGSVIYESAPDILRDFRYELFEKGFSDRSPSRTEKYFDADLTIIDDLGSEMPGNLASSTLYNIINTRLIHKKSTLISTNLSSHELISQYDRRITSRLLGEFTTFLLVGDDVRRLKT